MNDERRTPKKFFDCVNGLFQFTVDAAASDDNHLVDHYWTKEINGLAMNWNDHTVWCNPPYSRGQLKQWVLAAIRNRYATTLMLTPADCSTVAGQLALNYATNICFISERLRFDEEKSGAKFASWLVLFDRSERIRRSIIKLHALNLGAVR